MQMTLNSGKMILALMKSPQNHLFNHEFQLFLPMFLLANDRLWDLTLWVWSVASSAWERRRSDQSWNLVGTTLQITSEDLMPQRSAPAFTFGVGALILTGSCECLCLRLREWRIAGLIASSRLNDRRSQNFWTCYSPLCLLKLFFWKVTVVTLYLGLGTLIFTLGSYHGDKCGFFFLQFSWTGYIFVKNFKKLILTFWRVGFDSIYFQTTNFIGKRIAFTPSNSIISLSAAVAFLLKNEVMSGAHNRGLCSTKAANTVTDTDWSHTFVQLQSGKHPSSVIHPPGRRGTSAHWLTSWLLHRCAKSRTLPWMQVPVTKCCWTVCRAVIDVAIRRASLPQNVNVSCEFKGNNTCRE